MADEFSVNFSDPASVRELRARLATWSLRGKPMRFTVVESRKRRSDRQNRYYWPVFVHTFGEFLRDQGEHYTDDQIHEMYKLKFLRQAVINPRTGEVVGQTTRSTTELSTIEFNDYLDRIAHWLADMFHIVLPEPSEYHEPVEQTTEQREVA